MSEMNDIDLKIALARLDERQKNADDRATRTEEANERAMILAMKQADERRASDFIELQRRLHDLNNLHEMLLKEHGKMAGDYISNDKFAIHNAAIDSRFFDNKTVVFGQISEIRNSLSDLRGKLWLPMVLVASLAAGLAAAIVKLVIS